MILDLLEIQVGKVVRTKHTITRNDMYEIKKMANNGQSKAKTFDIVLDYTTRVKLQAKAR